MQPGTTSFDGRWLAGGAAALAFASAAVSLFWTLGGTLLLDTLGGELEDMVRARSLGGLALGAAAILLKVTAGLLALALLQPRHGRLRRRGVLIASGAASAILVLWGGANVLIGALVLGGVVVPSGAVDEHALRWRVFVWDLWFLVWGIALALAVALHRRRTP